MILMIRLRTFHLLSDTDSLVLGVIYEEEGAVPFGEIVPSGGLCALQITWKSRQLRFLKISVWNFGKIVLRRRFSAFGIKKTFINQILRFKQQLLEIAGLSRSVKGAFAS